MTASAHLTLCQNSIPRQCKKDKIMKHLIETFLSAKAAEEAAKQIRLQAEAVLISAVQNDKLEGTKTIKNSGYEVRVTKKLIRKLDYDEYQKIQDSLPEELQFVLMKPDIDLKVLRHLEAVDPKVVSLCVTTKPAKTAVAVKEV